MIWNFDERIDLKETIRNWHLEINQQHHTNIQDI